MVVNRALPFLHKGSLEITLTFPLTMTNKIQSQNLQYREGKNL